MEPEIMTAISWGMVTTGAIGLIAAGTPLVRAVSRSLFGRAGGIFQYQEASAFLGEEPVPEEDDDDLDDLPMDTAGPARPKKKAAKKKVAKKKAATNKKVTKKKKKRPS